MPETPQRSVLLRTLGRLPNWVAILLVSVFVAGAPLVLRLLVGEPSSWGHAAAAAVGVPMFALAMLWVQRCERRTDRSLPAGSPKKGRADLAVSRGVVPRSARAEEWIPELEKVLRSDRRWFPVLMLMTLAMAGASMALMVAGEWDGRTGGVYTVIALAGFITCLVWARRRLRTVERLIDDMRKRLIDGADT